MIATLVSCSVSLFACGLGAYFKGQASVAEKTAAHWRDLALRAIPRAPALTQIAPAFHAPRVGPAFAPTVAAVAPIARGARVSRRDRS